MRILVLGAGGIGGYYGGRLAAAGLDVTFLVRPRRAAQLAANGLVVKSPRGDLALPVKTIQRETFAQEGAAPGYDVILLSCKAYDLDDAIESIRPAAPGALILPLLNGLRHLDSLDAAFGADAVLGGVAQIGATIDPDGTVRHLNPLERVIFGERTPAQAERCVALAGVLAQGKFDLRHSPMILQDMWEKFIFLTSLAVMTCLMRANVGEINGTPEGPSLMTLILEDCAATAAAAGFPARPDMLEFYRGNLTNPQNTYSASMRRDLEQGYPVEADHIVVDMLTRAQKAGIDSVLLRAGATLLQCYQNSRAAA